MFCSEEINKLLPLSLEFNKEKEYSVAMAKKDAIDYIYNTASLEGNAMTFPEVQTLLEGVTVGGHKLSDEQQVLNQSRSVKLLLEMIESGSFKINKKTLCLLHAEVAKEEALVWGKFRDKEVNIGGTDYRPPEASMLDTLFETGIEHLNEITDPIVRALSYFLFGARSQFFFDGNKRCSRLMMNGILLMYGYPILNIKVKDKLAFNRVMIDFYDSGEYTKALEYLSTYYKKQNIHLAKS
jgi:Fic family protein